MSENESVDKKVSIEDTEILVEIKEAVEILCKNYGTERDSPIVKPWIQTLEKYKDSHRKEILKILNSQYRPTIINVNTVGAYLWGCNQNYYGDVSKNCSPLCHDAFPHDEDKIDLTSTCQYQIWEDREDQLHSQGRSSSNKAYIHITSENFKGLKREQIDNLKKNGIQYVTIITTKDSQHKILVPMTNIDNIKVFEEKKEIKKEKNLKADSVWNKVFYLIALLFLIIILGILAYEYRNKPINF